MTGSGDDIAYDRLRDFAIGHPGFKEFVKEAVGRGIPKSTLFGSSESGSFGVLEGDQEVGCYCGCRMRIECCAHGDDHIVRALLGQLCQAVARDGAGKRSL
jgi:hypothetical protein